jgi:CysZ protein
MALPVWLFPRFRSFWYGLALPFAAAKIILSHRTLILWSALPIALTTALYWILISRLQDFARSAMEQYFGLWGIDPQGWIAWVLMLFTKLLLLLVSALTFSIIASIAASPFNDFLAEEAERWTMPPLPRSPKTSWTEKLRLIWIDVGKTLAAMFGMIAALIFSWIPIVNLFVFLIAFLLVTFQYISYAHTRRGVGLGQGACFLWKHVFACAGFGATVSFLFALPFISGLCVPLAVVGGTMLVGRAQKAPGLQRLR